MGTTGKVIGACMGLTAYAVAAVAGLFAGAPATTVMLRALIAMGICAVAGHVLGLVATRAVREYLDDHVRENPVPERPDTTIEVGEPEDDDAGAEAEPPTAQAA